MTKSKTLFASAMVTDDCSARWTMKKRVVTIGLAIVAVAALPGCRKSDRREKPEPWWNTGHPADYSGTIPRTWPYCKPFINDDIELVPGFLVVEWTKDHPTIENAGVEVGDICLSWGTRDPEVPETLREAFLAYLCNNAGDDDSCWFARDRDGKIEVFSCCMGELHECMAAFGTFCLELRPVPFSKNDAERIKAAAAALANANMVERAELLTLSPPLQKEVKAFDFAFKTDDDSWRGRMDTMDDNLRRLALWRRGRSLSGPPDFVSEVAWRPDGTGGNGAYVPVGSDSGRNPARLLEFNLGTDSTPPLVLAMQTPDGGESRHPAQRASWRDLRVEQAATEPDPFVPEPQEPGFEKALHPSLARTRFVPVVCFEADDGTIAGRIDRLPGKRLGEEHREVDAPDFDDPCELYRIALFKCPVGASDEPETVFYATRRINGSGGSHTYTDVTWWHSLDVVVSEIDPPGAFLTELQLKRWSVASPELGEGVLDSRIPAHLIRWNDIVKGKHHVGTAAAGVGRE